MEIQEIGPAYDPPTFSYQKSKQPSTPTANALKISEFPPRRALHSLPKIKKYANRPQILEHNNILPYEKKKISIPSVSQLSRKKLLEAEILVDDFDNPNLMHLLAKAFKQLGNANKVTLKLNGYGDFNLPAIKWLVGSLSHLKGLTTITLHLPYHPKYKDGDYIKLLKSFTRNRHLENFELVVHVRAGVKSSVITRLHDALDKIKTLKKVSLSLALSEYTYRVKTSILKRGLEPKFESIGDDKLQFSLQVPYSLDRPDLIASLDNITQFKGLGGLKLDFSSFIQRLDGRIDDEILECLLPMFMRHQNLVHLDLSFEMSWYLEDTHITSLMKAISKLKNLKYLKLDFASCYGITDQSIKDTAKALYILPNLEQVSLNYASCYQLGDSSIQFLVGSLGRIKTLKRLELILSSCYKLTSKAAESFVLLQDLQALSLNLENAGHMDEHAVMSVAKALSKLVNLEMLSLNMSYLKKLTNYEFCTLGVALSGLSKLRYLCLDMGGYRELTESGFVNFFRKLEALKKLRGLSLSLRYCTQTSDRSLALLSIVTCGFEELKELKIDLIGSELLTEKCYPKLVKVFAKFEDSKKVEIYL